MCNQDIREYAKEHNVFWWQIAAELKKSESTMTRYLRFELSNPEKAKIRRIIDTLSQR